MCPTLHSDKTSKTQLTLEGKCDNWAFVPINNNKKNTAAFGIASHKILDTGSPYL